MPAMMQTVNGVGFPARCFAYVPDPDHPSTWKLRLYRSPEDKTPDATYVGACIAALGKGYRGQKVQLPSSDRAAVIAKVRAAWTQLHPNETPPPTIA
jgi:hypothetical protein